MSERAQTTIDFAVGASVFLLTVAFAFSFVPGLITPFASGQESAPAVSNRVADDLVQQDLAVEGDPYTLREPLNFDGPTLDVPPLMDANVTLTNESGRIASRGPTPPSDASTSGAWRVVSYQGDHADLRVTVW
ncbi:hypothetical protein EFA46_009665 [Halarchaeum sp. CBA1220]|uniref:DUF7287 family protein n=1 Tax=Halarchaeum sp. CBA1220 TaxID=1853682 RepID=UPI000F3A9D50|nr:hypothetical protein [Halarchaeum sp. CBA1220]QLC34460.1 hypothetical protein EFA46_009665 [Halarchaeum sp. CBA1220]